MWMTSRIALVDVSFLATSALQGLVGCGTAQNIALSPVRCGTSGVANAGVSQDPCVYVVSKASLGSQWNLI